MSKFKGTTALVTGASSGIGAAFSEQLASFGVNLVIVARRKERLDNLKKTIEEKYPIKVTVIAMDLSLSGAAQRLYDTIQKQEISIDILINNAGFGKKGRFIKEDLDSYQSMIHLNIMTMTELTYLFGQEMIKRGDGHILQVASIAGYMPVPSFAVYAATKAYVLNFGMAIQAEFAPGNVHVTTLCPGATQTEFFSTADMHLNKVLNTIQMNSHDVVKQGVEALFNHQPVAIPGAINRLMISGLNCVPRKIHSKIAEKVMG